MKEWLVNKLLGLTPHSNNIDRREWPKVEYVGNMKGALAKSEKLSNKNIQNKIIKVGLEWVVVTRR